MILWLLLSSAMACAVACGGAPSPPKDERPEITLETIKQQVNGEGVKVLSADGKTPPIDWYFDRSEPKEIEIVDQKIEGDRATFLVNMKTRTGPRARNPRTLSGQLRLHYELQSGLVFREWEIVGIENISFKYVNEAKPDANSNAANANANAGNVNGNANANAKPKANDNARANENSPRNSPGGDEEEDER